jgi:hypothetical protein
MINRILITAIGGLLVTGMILMSSGNASPLPAPTPTPSFDTTATITVGPPLPVPPGEIGVTGSLYAFIGTDGALYRVYQQITRVDPNATPAPTGTPTPTSTPTPSPTTSIIDDEVFTYFGSWTAYPTTTQYPKYGIGDHASDITGAAYGFIFTGTEVHLFGAIAPQNGIASVKLDNNAPVDVDLYSPTRMDQAPLYYSGSLQDGVHQIVIKVTGRKNPSATGYILPADRADIVGGTIVPPLRP